MEGYQEEIFKEKIISFLKTLPPNTGTTLAEVVIHTGIAIEWAEYTLRQLMDDFPVYVEINEKNELVYFFDTQPKPVSLKTLKKTLQWAYKASWWLVTVSFKAWILAMLFTYFLFNFAILIGGLLVVAGEGGGALLEGIFSLFGKVFGAIGDFFFKIIGWKSEKQIDLEEENATKRIALRMDGKTEQEIDAILTPAVIPQKNEDDLLQQIFSYVFGATNTEIYNDEYWEKRTLKLIEANKGILHASDLVKLQGISLHNARLHATKLVARHRGEISVNEHGIIAYHFPELITENTAEKPAPIWENPTPLEKMNDNDKETNQAIGWINGFNVLMSFISTFAIQFWFYGDSVMPDWVLLTSLIIPFLFSTVFFTIPLLRKPFVYFRNLSIKKQNDKAKTFKRIFEKFEHDRNNIENNPENNTKLIPENTQEEQIFIALEGTPTAGDNGKVGFDFPEIKNEIS